jgi:hypothetical protein
MPTLQMPWLQLSSVLLDRQREGQWNRLSFPRFSVPRGQLILDKNDEQGPLAQERTEELSESPEYFSRWIPGDRARRGTIGSRNGLFLFSARAWFGS